MAAVGPTHRAQLQHQQAQYRRGLLSVRKPDAVSWHRQPAAGSRSQGWRHCPDRELRVRIRGIGYSPPPGMQSREGGFLSYDTGEYRSLCQGRYTVMIAPETENAASAGLCLRQMRHLLYPCSPGFTGFSRILRPVPSSADGGPHHPLRRQSPSQYPLQLSSVQTRWPDRCRVLLPAAW